MDGGTGEPSYDEVPYPELVHPFTHPGRLSALGTLVGMTPAPAEQARVLELGCGAGGNLLPMAWGMPDACFVGVDLGATHIARARQRAAELGLTNVELVHADLRDLADLGTFDIVIAHGIYSWVPADVRDRILALTAEVLAPQGLAMVSFNCLPGWHFKRGVRDLMRLRTRDVTDPAERVALAREVAAIAVATAGDRDDRPRMALLNSYAAGIADADDEISDTVLLHDELGDINEPVYVADFIEHAAGHGLQYLVEAELRDSMLHDLPPHVQAAVAELGTTPATFEQYGDFFRNRTFRRAVLCRAELTLDRTLRTELVVDLSVSTTAVETEEVDGTVTFRSGDGSTFSSQHPLTIAAMRRLSDARPSPLRFRALAKAAAPDLAEPPTGEDNAALAKALVTCHSHSRSMIDLRTDAPTVATSASARPTAGLPGRLAARHQAYVANLLHDGLDLDERLRALVVLLDGTRDRDALRAAGIDGDHLEADLGVLARSGMLAS